MRSRGAPRIGEDGRIICWYGALEVVEELGGRAGTDARVEAPAAVRVHP